MPLTKQELIERCDKLIEMTPVDSLSIMSLNIIVYISTSAIFGDIPKEESLELVKIYLNKIEILQNKNKLSHSRK
jgi:hypothetical protein